MKEIVERYLRKEKENLATAKANFEEYDNSEDMEAIELHKHAIEILEIILKEAE